MKKIRSFRNIAMLILSRRLAHPKAYSQFDFSVMLGYKNGQFMSNVERGMCSIPFKNIRKISEILDIPCEEIKLAILKDYEATIENHLKS